MIKTKPSFTLIEAMIVIGILAILGGLVSLSLVNFGKGSNIESGRSIVIQAIRQAQNNSLANLGDFPWGVHFGSNKVVIFQDEGAGYNPNDPTNQTKVLSDLSVAANFGGGDDLLFDQGKSTTLTPGVVSISGTSNTTAQITVNTEGRIDY